MKNANNNDFSSMRHGRQSGGLVLNACIGIVVGLIAALIAVYFVMSGNGGPFKDHGNNNTLTPAAGVSTDPNAPLYGAPAQTLDPNANKPVSEGNAAAVLTDDGNLSPPPTASTKSATKQTAKAVTTPDADPLADVINAANGKSADKPKANDAPAADKPKVSASEKAQERAQGKAQEKVQERVQEKSPPKEVKPATVPKEVKPVVAP